MKRRVFYLQSVGLIITALLLVLLSRHFPLIAWISTAQLWVQNLGPASLLAYPALCGLCNVLLLPGGALVVGSGFFFGLWWGFLVALTGNLFGAAIAFALARWIGRSWIERKLLASPRWRVMDEVIAERGWRIVVLSQLHPLFPTSLINYFYGITRLPFWKCLAWIALGQTPGIFLYVYLGTLGQRGLRLMEGKWHPPVGESALWLGGLALSLAVTFALGRLSISLLREIDGRRSATPGADGGLDVPAEAPVGKVA